MLLVISLERERAFLGFNLVAVNTILSMEIRVELIGNDSVLSLDDLHLPLDWTHLCGIQLAIILFHFLHLAVDAALQPLKIHLLQIELIKSRHLRPYGLPYFFLDEVFVHLLFVHLFDILQQNLLILLRCQLVLHICLERRFAHPLHKPVRIQVLDRKLQLHYAIKQPLSINGCRSSEASLTHGDQANHPLQFLAKTLSQAQLWCLLHQKVRDYFSAISFHLVMHELIGWSDRTDD